MTLDSLFYKDRVLARRVPRRSRTARSGSLSGSVGLRVLLGLASRRNHGADLARDQQGASIACWCSIAAANRSWTGARPGRPPAKPQDCQANRSRRRPSKAGRNDTDKKRTIENNAILTPPLQLLDRRFS